MSHRALAALVLAASAGAFAQDLSPAGQAHVDQGLEAARRKDWKLATAYFGKALDSDPRSATVMFNLGLAHGKGGNEAPAIAWLHAYLAAQPQAPNAEAILAEIGRLKASLREKARKILASAASEAARLGGSEKEWSLRAVVGALASLGDLEAALETGNTLRDLPDPRDLARDHAVARAKAKDAQGALEAAERLDGSAREDVLREAADALIKVGDYAEAEALAARLARGKPAILKAVVLFHLSRGNLVPAEAHVDSLDESSRSEVRLSWSLKLLEQGDLASAARQARLITETSDHDVRNKGRAFMNVALEQLVRGDVRAAKETARLILGLGDRAVLATNKECLVVAATILGNVQGAYGLVARLQKAIFGDEKVWHYRQIAFVQALLGNLPGAQDAVDRSRQAGGAKYAGEGEAAVCLALLEKGDPEGAARYVDRTRYNIPAYLNLRLAQARVKAGDLAGAEAFARKIPTEPVETDWDPASARPVLARHRIDALMSIAAAHGTKPEAAALLSEAARLGGDPSWLNEEEWVALIERLAAAQKAAGDEAGARATLQRVPSKDLRAWMRLAGRLSEDKAATDVEAWLKQRLEGAKPDELPRNIAYAGAYLAEMLLEIEGLERRSGRFVPTKVPPKESKPEPAVAEHSPTVERKVAGLPAELRPDRHASKLSFSPDGRRWAFHAKDRGKDVVVIDGVMGEPFDEILQGPYGEDGSDRSSLRFSPDGAILAYFGRIGATLYPVVNGVKGEGVPLPEPKDDGLVAQHWTFSGDGSRSAYVLRMRDLGWAVIDGKRSDPFQELIHPVTFSRDSKRVLYAARKDNQVFVVVDGAPSPGYAELKEKPVFSPDGRRVAYAAASGGKSFAVVDGQAGDAYSFLSQVGFTPDNRVRYLVQEQPSPVPMVNGRALKDVEPWSKGIGDATPVAFAFDADHKRFACIVRRGKKNAVIVDGGAQEDFDQIDLLGFRGPRLAYRGTRDGKQHLVVDGVRSEAWDSIGVPAAAPETHRIAFVGKRGDVSWAAIDGVLVPGSEGAVQGVWSEDGKHLGWVAKSGSKSVAVVAGVRSAEYDAISILYLGPGARKQVCLVSQDKRSFVMVDGLKGADFDWIGERAVAPGGAGIAFEARAGTERFVVVDGVRGESFASIDDLKYSPDGRRLAYSGKRPDKKEVVVIDGFKSEAYDDVRELDFTPDSRVRFVARTGKSWYAVENAKKTLLWDESRGADVASIGNVVYSRDGSRTAFRGSGASGYSLVVDGVEQRSGLGGISRLEFSPDGRDLYYVMTPGRRWVVKTEGAPDRDVNSSIPDTAYVPESAFCLNPAGTRLAYSVETSKKPVEVRAVLDGKVVASYLQAPDESASMRYQFFAPDGERLVSVVQATVRLPDGLLGAKFRMFIDGRPATVTTSFDGFRFDPTGNLWAFKTYDEKFRKYISTSRGRGPSFDEVGPVVFSPDGKNFAYAASSSGEVSVVLNDKPVGSFSEIGVIRFTPDGKYLTFGARRGRELWWKVIPLP